VFIDTDSPALKMASINQNVSDAPMDTSKGSKESHKPMSHSANESSRKSTIRTKSESEDKKSGRTSDEEIQGFKTLKNLSVFHVE